MLQNYVNSRSIYSSSSSSGQQQQQHQQQQQQQQQQWHQRSAQAPVASPRVPNNLYGPSSSAQYMTRSVSAQGHYSVS